MSTAHPAAELLSAVLPITALQACELAGERILLAGSGCHLKVIDSKSRTSLCIQKVFERHAIHGIVPFGSSDTKTENGPDTLRLDFIVFGGKQIAWVTFDLIVCRNDLICSPLKVVDTIVAKDRVLTCKPSDHGQLQAAFVTSYNALYHVEGDRPTQKLKCQPLGNSIGVFLYSADLTQRCEKSYLVVSGTVFGQVLVSLCVYEEASRSWNFTPWIQFNGHRGSIFGVEISQPRFLEGKEFRDIVSCSDDRTICVWDLPGIGIKSSTSGTVTPNGFQQRDQVLTKMYGHVSRIWKATFSSVQYSDYNQLLIISAGEDGQVQSWSMHQHDRAEDDTPWVERRYVDRHHAGKNVWAQCHSNYDGMLVFTSGGADGQIISRRYKHTGRADVHSRHLSQSFKAIQTSISNQSLLRKSTLSLKTYLVADAACLLATTDTGHLLRASIRKDSLEWQLVAQDPKFMPLVLSLNIVLQHAFFIRTSDYMLCAIDHQDVRLTECCPVRKAKIANIWTLPAPPRRSIDNHLGACIAVSYHGRHDIELYWIAVVREKVEVRGKSSVQLPMAFEVTSVFYDEHLKILLCGSRVGALAVSTSISSSTLDTKTQLCKRRVHGQDTVTSISKLESELNQQQSQPYYLTTGRDGTYCIHKLFFNLRQEPCLAIVHQATPPVGPSIEGAYVVMRPDRTQSILFFGFHSKNFTVWDETCQTQIMNVDCGGAHRSWTFRPNEDAGQGGQFVWTKASTFTLYEQKALDHEIIQPGGHGREMKALATRRMSLGQQLLATGSEDTDIRLFEYTNNPSGISSVQNIAVLRKHTTGLQDLIFSPDGKILISAAGMEELYVWRLSPVPIIGQGVVFACASTSTDGQSDARVMSLDMKVLENHEADHEPSYLIAAASSNGKLKILQLDSAAHPAEINLTLLHTLDFGTICLTQARFYHYNEGVSGARDSSIVLVGATNGSIHICDIPTPNDSSTTSVLPPSPGSNTNVAQFHHNIHQNSITALKILQLKPTHHMVVTGGDDNALTITLTTTITSSPSPSPPLHTPQPTHTFKSLTIPTAHAAALTALHLLPSQSPSTPSFSSDSTNTITRQPPQHFHLITAGNDQRLQLWGIAVDVEALQSGAEATKEIEEVQVEWLGEWYTDVADISAIDVWRGRDTGGERYQEDGVDRDESECEEDFVEVVIVGVGMEVLRLDLRGNQNVK